MSSHESQLFLDSRATYCVSLVGTSPPLTLQKWYVEGQTTALTKCVKDHLAFSSKAQDR